MQVAPGLTVRVRDPYGGLIARNRLFVAFSVRYAQRAPTAPASPSVTWTLDGAAPRRDEGGRDQLLAPSTMYAAGRHVVGVRIAPVGRRPRRSRPSFRSRRPTASSPRCPQRPDRARRPRGRRSPPAGPALRAIELRPGQRALRGAARRAPGHGAGCPAGAPEPLRASRAEPRRAQPAHHRPAARHDRGPRAAGARRRRARAPLRAVGVAAVAPAASAAAQRCGARVRRARGSRAAASTRERRTRQPPRSKK